MKKIKYLFICVFLGTVMNSCSDAYDIEPDFILTEETTINNIQDLERLLLGTYDSGLGFASAVMINATASDNLVIGGGNAGQWIFEILWQYSPGGGSSFDGIWGSAYSNIYAVNRIIEAAQTMEVEEEDQALKNQILGEAYAIRAYSFFELARFFTPEYEPSAPSAYLVLEPLAFDADNIQAFPRDTWGEMIAQINADIETAKELIEGTETVYRFSDLAVKALEARVNLFVSTEESLMEAIELTSEILEQKPLSDSTSYIEMFRFDETSSEVIFKIERDLTDGYIGNNFRAGNGDIYASMSYELFGLLGASDARTEVLLDTETEVTEQTLTSEGEYVIGKYIGRDPEYPGLHDYIIFRSSEMLLIRAEAYARLGMLEEAHEDIVRIREVRNSIRPTPEYTTMAIALSDILLERRLELAYEGHRLLDLKRYNLPVERSEIDAEINRGAGLLPAGNFRFTGYIPQAEIDRNEGISEEDQNPGYN